MSDDTALGGNELIAAFTRKVGCIQYDPLDAVGRNPELVLQSRFPHYRKGDVEKYLYADRVLFDVWDKNMSICDVRDWAYFHRFRERYLSWCEEHKDTIQFITSYLTENESACSSDFEFEEKVGWHYGPQRLAKAALECMCYAGLAVVHHKKGTRRYYGLAERFIPEQYFRMEEPNRTEEEYFKWQVLRRINSIGVLWNKPGDAWLGIRGLKGEQRNQAFSDLQKEGKIRDIEVKGLKYPLYIAEENLELLLTAADKMVESKYARFLAPLDNLLWDRKLIAALFGFEYKWEVYTPVPERRYGYYVLPVLIGNKLAGRIEMETDKKSKTLIVKNFWAEEKSLASAERKLLKSGLQRFMKYNLCQQLEIACKI